MLIRPEQLTDHAAVQELHRVAFATHPDQVVSLVEGLRESLMAEAGLSLVAIGDDGGVVGHVLFTRNMLDAAERVVDVQVLSPLGVRPEAQGQGVGSALVREGLRMLGDAGVPAVFLEGSPTYYSRFGFSVASDLGFRSPSLRIPEAGFQVCLLPAYESWMAGTLVYRREFWDNDLVGLRPSDPHWSLLVGR